MCDLVSQPRHSWSFLWGMFGGIPGPHPLDGNGTHPVVTSIKSPNIAQWPLGWWGKLAPWDRYYSHFSEKETVIWAQVTVQENSKARHEPVPAAPLKHLLFNPLSIEYLFSNILCLESLSLVFKGHNSFFSSCCSHYVLKSTFTLYPTRLRSLRDSMYITYH